MPDSRSPEPLTDEAIEQIRAMLAPENLGADPTYDKNVQLLLGTSRRLLETLDHYRALAAHGTAARLTEEAK